MPSIRKGNVRRRTAARTAIERACTGRTRLIPNGFEPRSATIGDIVKIGFATDYRGVEQTEWMWCEVVETQGDGYTVVMANTSQFGQIRQGSRMAITSANVLTTYENCPLRAAVDLEHLAPGKGWDVVLDILYRVERDKGLPRRKAVELILANENDYRVAA